MMKLTELLHSAPDIPDPSSAAPIAITGITADSRAVKPGFLFVAVKGTKTDATQFVPVAIQAGAVAILCDEEIAVKSAIPVLRSRNVRKSLAQIAAAFYRNQPRHIVAITGTDGKTSTADFYRQFWHHLGSPSASIGTLGILEGNGAPLYPESQTTPNPVWMHQLLAEMAEKNIHHVAMEASSHGLDQYRLDGVRLEAAAFSNLTRDHLDYHNTEEAYFKAKLRLFDEVLPAGKTAVLNQDDAKFPALKAVCARRKIHVVGFGKNGSQYSIQEIKPTVHGQAAKLSIHGKPYTLDIPLAGAFQVFNIAAALALVEASGGALKQALAVISKLKGVPGRLEQVAALANGAAVYIDYAHTPMALANILKTLRPHTRSRLHVVFGCGGDRDAGKRPEMGRAANTLADVITVTDDNPRSEDPAAIRKAVLAACPRGKDVADRKQAIYDALKELGEGDILVIAGKGHEKTQTVGDKIFPFDDAQVVREGVKELRLAA
jgi:UDP-N-acetylmuramoyl-L-alanyl-D-glutamate--2,6-diaminopimelate ligase